ncbi:MAG: DUF4157 domain-containing protein [Kofleriaceae bacterium]|nr:DUF4157 domain-containing protein [Kofleriaceae bacterium]
MRRDRRPQVQSEEQEQEESEAQESSSSTSVRGGTLPAVQSSFASSSTPTASERAYGLGASAYTGGGGIHFENESPELESHESTHVVQQRRGH